MSKSPKLVLVHGFAENSKIWYHSLPFLKDEHPVVLYDIPGFGDSRTPLEAGSFSELASVALRELKKEAPYVLVGHSMGGYLALAMAKQQPEDFLGMVLLHSTAAEDTDEKRIQRNRTIEFIEQHGKEKFLESFVPNLFYKKESQLINEYMTVCLQTEKSSLIKMTELMRDRQDSQAYLKNFHFPMLWLAGKEDALIPYTSLFAQTEVALDGQLHLLSQVGHMGMLENPQKTAYALSAFHHYCTRV